MPWWAAVTLGLLALVRLGQAWIARPAPDAGGPTAGSWRSSGLVVALAAYVALLEPLGYPLCTFLLGAVRAAPRGAAPVDGGDRRGGVAAIGSFVVFAVWLKVPLPPGPPLR